MFIYECRQEKPSNYCSHDYDYVSGYLADGKINTLVHELRKERISFGEFQEEINPYTRYSTQLSFHTTDFLVCIEKLEVKDIE